ncbi:MAG: hypothetical protein P8182_07465 [Deltaproteobacteria bacterium]
MRALSALVVIVFLALPVWSAAEQLYKVPNVSSMKHVTSRSSDRAPDIPGKETSMEYYSAPDGQIVTIYSYRGRNVAFSVHSNKDVQKTYRLFMDLNGNGLFQEVPGGTHWQLPGWAR